MRFAYLGVRHIISILRNEIEVMRYKLRAEAFDQYVNDVSRIVDTFLIEHNRKMEKFFFERKKELTTLMSSLEMSLKQGNYTQATRVMGQIGNQYGFEDRFNTLDEFEDFMMSDD